MATRIMIEDMLDSMCSLFGKIHNSALTDAWSKALFRYRDHEIQKAGQRALEECQKMPTPMDVISRITSDDQTNNGAFTMTSTKCSKCHRVLLCISEPSGSPYLCRECYTGLTNQQISDKFNQIADMLGKSNALD